MMPMTRQEFEAKLSKQLEPQRMAQMAREILKFVGLFVAIMVIVVVLTAAAPQPGHSSAIALRPLSAGMTTAKPKLC
jgi:hypothetical protein